MNRYLVLKDSQGGTFAGATWAEAIELASPDKSTRFVDAAWVDASDAGAARLLLNNNGARSLTLQPPRLHRVWAYDAWGNLVDGFTVNDRSELGWAFLSDDMDAADVAAQLGSWFTFGPGSCDACIMDQLDGTWELARRKDDMPLGQAEAVEG